MLPDAGRSPVMRYSGMFCVTNLVILKNWRLQLVLKITGMVRYDAMPGDCGFDGGNGNPSIFGQEK